jgi:hypothetical protein
MRSKTSAALMLIAVFLLGCISGGVSGYLYQNHFGQSLTQRQPIPAKRDIVEEIAQSLHMDAQQKEKLAKMRTTNPSDPKGPFLYSSPIDTPKIENTDFLFGVKRSDLNAPSTVPGAQGK